MPTQQRPHRRPMVSQRLCFFSFWYVCELSNNLYVHGNNLPQGSQLRRSVRKLCFTHSQIMLTYYATLWAVSVLNLLRCGVMMVEARYTGQAHWNALWLLTSSVSVLLEVSVVVFLLQGYLTSGSEVAPFDVVQLHAPCCLRHTHTLFSPSWHLPHTRHRQALLRTLALSGPIALADCAIKAALLHAGVPLFLYGYVDDRG